MIVEIISWSISTKVWGRTGIELATPESAVRHESVARHVTDCATGPGFAATSCKVNCKHGTRDVKYVDVTSKNVTLWQTFPQFFGIKDQNRFKNQKECQKKAYNKHIITIVTWSGVQHHASWMRPYHWITLDATLLGWSDGMTSSTRRDTVRQIKLLLW